MPLEDVDLVSEAPCQERTVLAQQELQIVRRVILELLPKCRKVFLLSRTHCKTYPEIAELCGISVKTVEKYISQALAALPRELGGGPWAASGQVGMGSRLATFPSAGRRVGCRRPDGEPGRGSSKP